MKQQIYFVQRADGLIKIGYSATFGNRLAQLRKSHEGLVVLKVINGDRRKEREIHYQFEAAHEYGEWFRPEGWMMDVIESITDGETITFSKTPEQLAWAEHEKSVAQTACDTAKRLYALSYRPVIDNQETTVDRISKKHGIPSWPFKHLLSGRCNTPSAALVDRVRKAIRAEQEERLSLLNSEIEDLKSTEDTDDLLAFPDQIEALRSRLTEIRARLQ